MPKEQIELACPTCGSNRLSFPSSDDEPVTCEDCGAAVQSLRAVKLLMSGGDGKTPAERAVSRRERHGQEIKASQAQVRRSIKEIV
jgi:ribosomal protein S27E